MISGKIISENCVVNVDNKDNKYKYTCIKGQVLSKDHILITLMIDYSYSMHGKNAETATIAVKEILDKFYNNGYFEILLILFGKTACSALVNKDNYIQTIDEILCYYFIDAPTFDQIGKFSANGTYPEFGFDELASSLISQKKHYSSIQLLFFTDGQFTGTNYSNVWNQKSRFFDNMSNKNIFVVGYKNDDVKNIQEMKIQFEKNNTNLTYKTITNYLEIIPTFNTFADEIINNNISSVKLGNYILMENDTLYTNEKLYQSQTFGLLGKVQPQGTYDDFVQNENDAINTNVDHKEWLDQVIECEMDIGLDVNNVINKINEISKQEFSKQNILFGELFNTCLINYDKYKIHYIKLKSKYSSIKSRGIIEWKYLNDVINRYIEILNSVQTLLNSTSDKQNFETATNISLSSRHARTLQRRIIKNNIKKSDDELRIIEVNDKEIKFNVNNKTKTFNHDLNIFQLNETFVCNYTLMNWEELLDTCICVPISYVWNENDDWKASSSNIDKISIASYISFEGYENTQKIYGTNNHKDLYGKHKYLMSSLDKCNAVLPICIDPLFSYKINSVKKQLSKMITGTEGGFRGSHILLYVSAIKTCFYQMLTNNSEKLKNVTLLLLNTFRKLFNVTHIVFDKNQQPIGKSDIIYNIAVGNTAPHLFGNPWETIVYLLIISKNEHISAYNRYCNEIEQVDDVRFKQILWEKIVRYFAIYKAEHGKNDWRDQQLWNLPNKETILDLIKSDQDISNYLLTGTKVQNEIPKKIIDDLNILRYSKFSKALHHAITFYDYIYFHDKIWDNFMNIDINTVDTLKYISYKQMDYYIYWGNLEYYSYGSKNCYPMKSINAISDTFAKIINNKYGCETSPLIKDKLEKMTFEDRHYECRILPVSFTNTNVEEVNKLFVLVNKKEINKELFIDNFCKVMGENFMEICKSVEHTDGFSVLGNLYDYVLNMKEIHEIVLNQIDYHIVQYHIQLLLCF